MKVLGCFGSTDQSQYVKRRTHTFIHTFSSCNKSIESFGNWAVPQVVFSSRALFIGGSPAGISAIVHMDTEGVGITPNIERQVGMYISSGARTFLNSAKTSSDSLESRTVTLVTLLSSID